MNYIELTKIELESEKKMLEKYNEQISQLPHRNMVCKEIRGKKRYYLSGSAAKYIRDTDSDLIRQIKRYHFSKKAVSLLKTNIAAQERLLRAYRLYDYVSINNSLPKVYRLDQQPLSSKSMTYAPAMHTTSFGLQVRSKSEALIAEMLYSHGVVFEYELPLWLKKNGDKILLRPDFTVTTKGGVVYWEHMGLIGDEDYREKALQKLDSYLSNGITIPDKLIVTMDSSDGAIDMTSIGMIIQWLSA